MWPHTAAIDYEQLNEAVRQTERDVTQLGVHIDKGHIANTRKLMDYGEAVKAQENGTLPSSPLITGSTLLRM